MSSLFSDAPHNAPHTQDGPPYRRRVNFEVPRAAALQIASWALDVAAESTDDAEDIERIGRVRRCLYATADSTPAKAPTEEDLLTVLAIVIDALEVDCAAPGLGRSVAVVIEEMDPLLGAICGRVTAPLRVGPSRPSLASRCRAPAVVRHRFLLP